MEYLQYIYLQSLYLPSNARFKPYYKWNTFNTTFDTEGSRSLNRVLNLIINGIPSIRQKKCQKATDMMSFKPYYKWNTFNTFTIDVKLDRDQVLNLIINGIPSIHLGIQRMSDEEMFVLNLIINGIPSIHLISIRSTDCI